MPALTPQDITDISSADQLLRYAAAGQLLPLEENGYTHERIAVGAGLGSTTRTAGPVLATALRTRFTAKQLSGLDEIIGALAPELDRAGRLSSLAVRLSADQRADNGESHAARFRETVLPLHVPPSWTRRMLTSHPATETGVLMDASGVLSEFVAAGRMGQPGAIGGLRRRHATDLDGLTRRLILLSS